MPPIQYTSFAAALATVPDPRAARGQRYPWSVLLLLVAAAVLHQQTTVRAMADWLRWQTPAIRRALSLALPRLPSAATLYRTLPPPGGDGARNRPRRLQPPRCCSRQPLTPPRTPLAPASPPLRGLALDGKTVRGALTHGQRLPFSQSWWTTRSGARPAPSMRACPN